MTTTPTATTYPADKIFGDAHPGNCCPCCAGYCILGDSEGWSPANEALYQIRVNDSIYMTDRYVAIRDDLIERPLPPGATAADFSSNIQPPWRIPATKPEESTADFTPSLAARLLALGIDITQGDPTTDGGRQHLYAGTQHIGWIQIAAAGCSLAEIREFMTLARDRKCRGDNPRHLHLSDPRLDRVDTVAEALRWAREVTAP